MGGKTKELADGTLLRVDQVGAFGFQRRVVRADQIVESQGVVTATLGEGIARAMAQYQGEIDDLD